MAEFIYTTLFIINFLLGYNIKKENYLKAFVLLSFTLPFTNFTTPYHTIFQVSVYLLFFVGAIVRIIPKLHYRKFIGQINTKSRNSFIAVFALFILYLPLTIEHALIDVLIDLKPYVYIGLIVLFLNEYSEQIRERINTDFLQKCLQINCIVAVLFYAGMHFFDLHLLLIDDPYYINNELRYTNLASYTIPLLFLGAITSSAKLRIDTAFYMLIPMLLTGNRTIILVCILLAIIYYFTKWNMKAKITAIFISPIIISGCVFALSFLSDNSSLSRFKKLLDTDYLTHAISNRLEPILSSFENYEWWHYIIGNGFGYTYYIPWFEYRTHINNYNSYLDNIYATLYGKFGVLLIVPIAFFVIHLQKYSSKETFRYLLFYFLLIGLTNSFMYQTYLPWFIFIMAITLNTAKQRA